MSATATTTRPAPAWRRVVIAAAVLTPVLGVLAVLGYGFVAEPRYIPSPLLSRPAPHFTLTLFDGKMLRLDALLGKVVVVNFWASWCPPCRVEARDLEAAWRKHQDQGVVFIGVNTQDEEPRAREFIEEFGLTYPNGRDLAGKIAIDYGVWGLPETFFIDAAGRITYKHVGALGWDTIIAKLEEARRGVLSASEGRGDYISTR